MDHLRELLTRNPRGLDAFQLAAQLGVTERSVRRYLAELGRDLDFERARDTRTGTARYRLHPNDIPRRVEFRRNQAYGLLAARRLFDPLRGSAIFEEVDMALGQLLAVARRPGRGPNAGVVDARLEDRFLYLPFAARDYSAFGAELDVLFQAVADLRPMACRYLRVKTDEEARITIHPYALLLYKDAIYCVGLHVQKGEVRTFLLDRMQDAELLPDPRFELPDGFSIDPWVQGQFGVWQDVGEPAAVAVDFDARVAEFVRTRRVHPSQWIEERADGSVRLHMRIADLTEVVPWVIGFGDAARAIAPPELAARVRASLAAALARYEEPTPEPAPATSRSPATPPPETAKPPSAKRARAPKKG